MRAYSIYNKCAIETDNNKFYPGSNKNWKINFMSVLQMYRYGSLHALCVNQKTNVPFSDRTSKFKSHFDTPFSL